MELRNNLKRIRVFLKDPDKKNFSTIIIEVTRIWYLKKRFPLHYFGWFLYRKHIKNSHDFLDLKEYYSIIKSKILNIPEYLPFLENKLAFALICDKFQIDTPKTISYNLGSSFFINEQEKHIENKEALYDFFKIHFKNLETDKIFIKSLCGHGGKGSFCLEKNNLKSQIEKYHKFIFDGSYVHQWGITQHSAISKIYPNSVNTIRIDTYIANDKKTHVLAAAMRFGTGGSSFDNVSSGGFFVPINMENCTLMSHSLEAMIYGGKRLTEHPDTNHTFNGFIIPYFEEAKNLCIKLTNCIPNRIAGWDIAITNDGPVVIEGNHHPGITMGQFAIGGYAKHPLYKEIMSNAKL